MNKLKSFGKNFSITKRFRVCLTIAFVIHSLIIFFCYFQQKLEEIREQRLISVEYKEEEKRKEEKKQEKKEEKPREEPQPKINPQVATITMKEFLQQKNIGVEKIDEEYMKKLEKIARPMEGQVVDMKIDIDKMIEMHSSQAEIDLSAYAEDIDIGDMAIVRIGKGISTNELLKQDAVQFPKEALALPAKIGMIGMPGFSGTKGGGGLEGGGKAGEAIDIEKTSSTDIASQKEEMKKAMTQKKTTEQQIDVGAKKPTTEVEISVALRERLLSMVPPPYPEWAQQQGLGGTITFQLKIDENGQMTGTPITICTTGYPEWDNGVMAWVRSNWKWVKKPNVTSTGTVTIRFIIG